MSFRFLLVSVCVLMSASLSHAQLAITEFLSSNYAGLTDELLNEEDWVEIQNTSSSTVNLSGWYLTDDASNLRKWPFPAWTLNAGNRLVVFASARDKRPVQTTAGLDNANTLASPRLATNFKLANNAGGYLALTKDLTSGGLSLVSVYSNYPRQFANVSSGFSTGGTTAAGVSLFAPGPGVMRYLVPTAATPATWNTPDFDASAWTAAAGTTIGFDSDETTNVGSTSYLPYFTVNLGKPVSGVPHVMWSVNSCLYTRYSFDVADKAAVASLLLKIKYEDGFVAWLNGVEVARGNFTGSAAYNSITTARIETLALADESFDITTLGLPALRTGTNVLAIQGINGSASSNDFLLAPKLEAVPAGAAPPVAYFASPTPGAANSAEKTNVAPYIGTVTGDASELTPGVLNLPARPAGGAGSAPLVVTARVAASQRELATSNPVQLKYLVMYGAEVSLNMADNGVAPDAVAADGIYTAQIPTTSLTAGQMLRWRVTATDSAGNVRPAPEYLSTTDSDQYYGTVAADTISTQLSVYHVFVPGAYTPNNTHAIDLNNLTGGRGSIFYDGELYDNVNFRIKGDTTRTLNKRAHRVDFNSAHKFRFDNNAKRLRELALNAEYVDPSYSRQFMSMWLHRSTSGLAATRHFPVRTQINGAFWQLAFHTETQDSEVVEYMGLDGDGAIYAAVGQMITAGGEKQSRVWEAGNADQAAFITAITATPIDTTRKNNVFDQIDIPALVNYMVCARMTQEADDVWSNVVIHRDSNGTGEWRVIPFDLNLSWGQLYYADYTATNGIINATDDTNKSHPFYGTSQCGTLNYATGRWQRMYDAIISVPETRAMFLRRMRTVMDTYLQAPGTANPVLEAQLDAHIARISPEVALDKAIWGWPAVGGPYGLGNVSLTTAVNDIKNSFIAPRRTHFFNTHTSTVNVGLANSNSAGIPNAPQPATFPLTIAGYEGKPTGVGKQDEEYVQITNPNAFAADISGWKLAGAVDFTFKAGTVINAGGSLYVSPKQQAFRARAVSPRGGEGRFVVGPYSGQISARGENIQILNPAGFLVTSLATTVAPTAAQNQLRITEINYNPPDPSPAELAALPNSTATDFEFLELTNTGATALNVGGATFSKGVTFTFPANYSIAAGASVLIVANQPAFTFRHGSGKTVAGTFWGNLSNSGEAIELLDPAGESVLDFTYDDAWFPETDGKGKTLVVSDAAAPYTAWDTGAAFWRASQQPGGTPGSAIYNTAPVAAADPYTVNEDNLLTVTAPGVLGNDTDAEHTPLQAFLVAAPSTGTLNLALDGSFTYAPPANFNGQVTFTYQAGDGIANSATATVTITVGPVNDLPAFAADPIAAPATAGTPLSGQLSATDADAGAVLSFAKQSGPAWLTVSASGGLSGTPANSDAGLNVFSVSVSDGSATVTATLNVMVTAVGPTLTAFNVTNFTAPERANPGVSGPAADPDGDGIPNLLEYAFGTNPRDAGGATRQVLPTVPTVSDQAYAALTFTRIKGATDLAFLLEVSSTPGDAGFAEVPSTVVTTVDNLDGTETVTLRETAPIASGTTLRFVRLRVRQN